MNENIGGCDLWSALHQHMPNFIMEDWTISRDDCGGKTRREGRKKTSWPGHLALTFHSWYPVGVGGGGLGRNGGTTVQRRLLFFDESYLAHTCLSLTVYQQCRRHSEDNGEILSPCGMLLSPLNFRPNMYIRFEKLYRDCHGLAQKPTSSVCHRDHKILSSPLPTITYLMPWTQTMKEDAFHPLSLTVSKIEFLLNYWQFLSIETLFSSSSSTLSSVRYRHEWVWKEPIQDNMSCGRPVFIAHLKKELNIEDAMTLSKIALRSELIRFFRWLDFKRCLCWARAWGRWWSSKA